MSISNDSNRAPISKDMIVRSLVRVHGWGSVVHYSSYYGIASNSICNEYPIEILPFLGILGILGLSLVAGFWIGTFVDVG